jgi:hypothetical protein
MNLLRIRSRWLARAILGVLLLLLAVPTIVAIAVLSGRYQYGDLLAQQLPMVFYACALWSIRGALSAYAGGGSLVAPASGSIQTVGIELFLGGLSNVFAVPLVLRAMHGRGTFAHFDVPAIALGAVGLSLVVFGRLLADAEAAQRELEEFV